ncbi:hypothetical protein GOTRE_039_01350 [Gordonia terrae NBRC 100016]|uniref:Uncharacterized protein n=1 Tax=Gordonia terrae NBRC 100016 TaxID=1089454 RepID=A0ABQ0HBP7_9ACTN|nr:hypothetical protein GOTRE_039_01350 [Gordonia terrae NBRC 100016]
MASGFAVAAAYVVVTTGLIPVRNPEATSGLVAMSVGAADTDRASIISPLGISAQVIGFASGGAESVPHAVAIRAVANAADSARTMTGTPRRGVIDQAYWRSAVREENRVGWFR